MTINFDFLWRNSTFNLLIRLIRKHNRLWRRQCYGITWPGFLAWLVPSVMQVIWTWLTKVASTFTPRRLIMFGLVFLFAYRRGVVRVIRSHFFQLSMDPTSKETAQGESSSQLNHDQQPASHSVQTTESSKDERTIIDKNGSDDERRLSYDNLGPSSFSTPSTSKQTDIILSENPSTSNECGNTPIHAKKTITDRSGEKMMIQLASFSCFSWERLI